MSGSSYVKKPATKNAWSEASAADVIGPVESGDRMRAKNGDSNVERDIESTSTMGKDEHRGVSEHRKHTIGILDLPLQLEEAHYQAYIFPHRCIPG